MSTTLDSPSPPTPPPLAPGYKTNLETLIRAARNGDLAVISAIRKADQAPVALLVAMQRNDDETITPVPFGEMCPGNPFELYEDPTV